MVETQGKLIGFDEFKIQEIAESDIGIVDVETQNSNVSSQ
jgi:hypothetical protein